MNNKRSLWKRLLPVKIRQNMGVICLSIIILIVMCFFLGSVQIRPTVFTTGGSLVAETVEYIEGTVDFFDQSQPHSISLTVNDFQYQRMQDDYLSYSEKSWIVADAIIDGTFIPSVGIRLKGNSTLFPLTGLPIPTSNATFSNPSTLPLVLSFAEFSEGREYQGHSEMAIRSTYTASTTAQEALALQLISDSGQISQQYSYVTFQVNGSPSATRLVIENPDQGYAVSLDRGEGVLYKSRSANAFIYYGEDPTEYEEDFVQLSALGVRDLSPVIGLLRWLNTVTQEEFDAELAGWVDIPSFAKYVATHSLLVNFDDMSGPGHNFLLWYDIEDEKFTVISWDLNLALSETGIGFGLSFGFDENGEGTMSEERRLEFGVNSLKDFFIASEVFAEEIAKARTELYELWFDNERSFEIVAGFAEIVPVTDILSAEEIEADLEKLEEFIVKRQTL
ncbi:MAG: CotH kinase family protein [Gammaproteobacteria bacterium]|nr:CotH kinase family protein [Gammaproteobacteria bacterium]